MTLTMNIIPVNFTSVPAKLAEMMRTLMIKRYGLILVLLK